MKDNLKAITILLRATHSVEDALKKDISKYGLNTAEFGTLEYLLHKGHQPMQNICEKLLMANSSMTYVIDKLEKKNYVSRRNDSSDRRMVYIDLTDEGRSFIESIFPSHESKIDEIFKVLSLEELNNMMTILKKLGKSLN